LLDKRAKCAINNFLQEITNVDEINKRIIELLDIWKTNIYKYILYTSIYKYIQDSTENCDDNGDNGIDEVLLPEYLNIYLHLFLLVNCV